MNIRRWLCAVPVLALCAALTGCGVGTLTPATPGSVSLHLNGRVIGGQQPVAGAHVHVFQAIFGSKSKDLIGADPSFPVNTSDSLGYYVATTASGNFSITGDYFCAGAGPVYLLATQGNPGLPAGAGTNNSALALLAVVADSCGIAATLSPSLVIDINEISTVTGVYALAGYLSAPDALTFPGNNSANLPVGLTNAADTAMALENLQYGTVNATTASGGTVPAAAITTLANILAGCVNSNGTTNACTTLFNNATSNGIAAGTTGAGTVPTDTVTALLNIAHNTGVIAQSSSAMTALYGLAVPTAPFAGGLTAQPNDFSLAVSYAPTYATSPGIPAVDAAGNVWFPSTKPLVANSSLYYSVQVTPQGKLNNLYAGGTTPAIMAAMDPSSNAWLASSSGGAVVKVTPSGTATSYNYHGTSNDNGHQIAIDASGNVYISDSTVGNLFELSNTGMAIGNEGFATYYPNGLQGVALLNSSTAITSDLNTVVAYSTPLGGAGTYICSHPGGTCFGGGLTQPSTLAVDSSAHIWALNANSTLSGFNSSSSSGGPVPGSPFSGGGLNTVTVSTTQPYPWLAIDGANNIWTANYTGVLSEFTDAGVAVSPMTGLYGSTISCKGQGLAIDGSGNIWVGCDSATAPVLEFIGLATPVTTPLLPGNFGVKP